MLFGRRPAAHLACELGSVGGGDTVLDVGCGPGVAAREAARRGATVTGVDPASGMLRLGRLLSRGRVTYRIGVAEHLPLADASCTVAWSLSTAHHWEDVDAGLRELLRVLAPGGRLVVLERRAVEGASGHASHGWTEAQAQRFAERCGAAGFTSVEVGVHPRGHRATISVRGLEAG